MELKTLLLPEKVVTFDFPGLEGLTFDLAFLSKESNQALYKKCLKTKFNARLRQPEEEFDDEMFLELFVASVVKGWSGFKLKYLRDLVLSDIPLSNEEEELDYSQENALELMKNSSIFDNWVSEVISDLGNFTKNNSKPKFPELKDISKSQDQA